MLIIFPAALFSPFSDSKMAAHLLTNVRSKHHSHPLSKYRMKTSACFVLSDPLDFRRNPLVVSARSKLDVLSVHFRCGLFDFSLQPVRCLFPYMIRWTWCLDIVVATRWLSRPMHVNVDMFSVQAQALRPRSVEETYEQLCVIRCDSLDVRCDPLISSAHAF